MHLFFLIQTSLACPKQDIHPVGIDPYVIKVGDKVLSLDMDIDDKPLSSKPVVKEWQQLLASCNEEPPTVLFRDFVRNSDNLYALGIEYSDLPFWALRKKIALRKQIRELERNTALSYAYFLKSFQLETGVAITWDPEAHPLAQGMISTARGSEFVADYIIIMWK